jgi:GDSL-like Lipase/Acylhydrolase
MNFRTIKLLAFTFIFNVLFAQTFLDYKFTPFFRLGRNVLNDFVRPKSLETSIRINMQNNKIQKQISAKTPFFCDIDSAVARSKTVPTSVHKLRPGDIDVIGSIGDSLTAANGVFAVHELQVLLEGRGVSWSIGGQGNWRQFLTLPNILKVYNPNIYGYAVEDSTSYQKASKFNVAEPGAMSSDTIHQSKNLVKRMRSDKNVNIKKHWKMITHMIGGNDFC